MDKISDFKNRESKEIFYITIKPNGTKTLNRGLLLSNGSFKATILDKNNNKIELDKTNIFYDVNNALNTIHNNVPTKRYNSNTKNIKDKKNYFKKNSQNKNRPGILSYKPTTITKSNLPQSTVIFELPDAIIDDSHFSDGIDIGDYFEYTIEGELFKAVIVEPTYYRRTVDTGVRDSRRYKIISQRTIPPEGCISSDTIFARAVFGKRAGSNFSYRSKNEIISGKITLLEKQ